jgi:hypothetical protein
MTVAVVSLPYVRIDQLAFVAVFATDFVVLLELEHFFKSSAQSVHVVLLRRHRPPSLFTASARKS